MFLKIIKSSAEFKLQLSCVDISQQETLVKKITVLHERALRIAFVGKTYSFNELLEENTLFNSS